MRAEIICVGTELLLGDIVNTNASFLSKELASMGIEVYHQSVVGDNPQRLKLQLKESFSRSDLVITSGGLGPTYDDLTKQTVAEYFGLPMEQDAQSLEWIEAFFKQIGRPMTENNIRQADIPKGGKPLKNHNGTAPGVYIKERKKQAILLPGPPSELEALFFDEVKPILEKETGHVIRSHTLNVFGMGEAQLESILHERMIHQKNPTIAPYAKTGEVQVRVTAFADTEEEADRLIFPAIEEIKTILGDVVYGVDALSLENALVKDLQKEGKTIATAESCTGGQISERITSISGASEVFGYGVCTYANEAKEKLLGVKAETLEAHGAVSKEVAKEMAEGVRRLAGSDIGVATTGIAGPTGGSSSKPVGLVYVGVSSENDYEVVELHLARGYHQDRSLIQHLAASHALHLARMTLKKGKKKEK